MSIKKSSFLLYCIFLLFSFHIFQLTDSSYASTDAKGQHLCEDAIQSPIHITGNNDLLETATEMGWIGTGTEEDPIIIEGYHFRSSLHMFTVSYTTLFFSFQNNELDGINQNLCAMVFFEIQNGAIVNNTVYNANVGIHLIGVNDTLISGNTVYSNFWDAIFMEAGCFWNTIQYNEFYDNGEGGVYMINDCHFNIFQNNTIHRSPSGLLISPITENNTIIYNHIYNTTNSALSIFSSNFTIYGNYIHDVRGDGITILGKYNTIQQNIVDNCTEYGIYLPQGSSNCSVYRNSIKNANLSCIYLRGAKWVQVTKNDFFGMSYEEQAIDTGMNNTFSENYWSECTGTDTNNDGIFDSPQAINGSASNFDLLPKIEPNNYVPSWITQITSTTSTSTFIPTLGENQEIFNLIGIGVMVVLTIVILIALQKTTKV